MAYYTGSANSFAELLTALVNACVAEGWTWADSILSKGSAFIRPYVSVTTTDTEGPGLLIQGGTGKSGGTLTGASDVIPRFGRPGASTNFSDVAFPVEYRVHVFSDPDEVFLIVRYGVDRFGWLAFGVSDIALPGTGMWLAGIARRGYIITNSISLGYGIQPGSGANSASNIQSAACSPGFLWASGRSSVAAARQDCIHANLDGEGWSGAGDASSAGAFNAIFPAVPLVAYSPSAWNNEAPLIPIQGHVWRPAAKCSLAVEIRNARYIRIDNYEPEQRFMLGAEEWVVYPFHLKDPAGRNGASNGLAHSGTFGWAIRYDGP